MAERHFPDEVALPPPPRSVLPPFEALRAFDAIARLGGVRRAAQHLCRDHGVVSRHLRAVEDWTGTRLIERTPAGAMLTTDGVRYHKIVAAAMDSIADATVALMRRNRNRQAGGHVVLFAAAASLLKIATAVAVAGWDVSETGQPYRDVEFTTTSGTWVSLDVSPDGAWIAFDLLGDIYKIPAAGGEAEAILDGPAYQRTPTFSPDGRRLAFISDRSGSDNVWTANPDGTDAKAVTAEKVDPLMAPAWTPDGRAIAAVHVAADAPRNYTSEIRLYYADATALPGGGQLLVEAPRSNLDVQEAAFSPDGHYVYYTERLKRRNIYVDATHMNFAVKRRNLSSGETVIQAEGWGGAIAARPSADGRHLAFVRRIKEKTVLFRLDLETQEEHLIFDRLDRDLQADYVIHDNYYPRYAWFPDDVHVAIWGGGGIWKVNMMDGSASQIPFRVHARHRVTERLDFSLELAPREFEVRSIRHVELSPDGGTLVFAGLGRLWRKKWPDGPPRPLTGGTAFEFEPAWSSDGRRLVFAVWDDEKGGAVVVANADGGQLRIVTRSRGVVRQPRFSPDGEHIVFRIQSPDAGMGGAWERPGIHMVGARGEYRRFVVPGDDFPMFSPDGGRIWFVSRESAGGTIQHVLNSVTPSGLDLREHARTRDADTSEVRPSPDLRWITFKDRQKYHVVPFRQTGTPLLLFAANPEVPSILLSESGGFGLSWKQDSTGLQWALGSQLHRAGIGPDGALHAERAASAGLTVPADVPEGMVAFTNARVITMVGDQVIERGTVVVQRNRIVSVGPSNEVRIPRAAKIVDAAGRTIMPGLVDAHGHIECCYGAGAVPQKQPHRYAALAFGVTTNFDPYTNELVSFESGETTLAGITLGPRWITTGAPLYGRARQGSFTYVPIDDFQDARAVVARKQALGAPVIKSYKQPARYQRQMLVKAARERGLNVAAEGESHYHYDITMILDGSTTLEHNLPVANYYDDVVQLMKLAGARNTPVLNVLYGELFGENFMYQKTQPWTDARVSTYVPEVLSGYSPLDTTPYDAPPYVRGMTTIHVADELWDVGFRGVSRATKKLDDAGVGINVGSHGQIPGLAMHWEMALLSEGGMSPARVLRAATINAAESLGIDHQVGTLESGKLADLIVLARNPLDDIRNSESVELTMINGRLYDSKTLREIGNYDRPRGRFYWELESDRDIDWNPAWAVGER
jgi:Tol biopolymer transport system component